jgi:hypothetical protein
MKMIESNEKRRQKGDDEIRNLKDIIDEERRKSMVDEGKIKELEQTLAKKIKHANEQNAKINEMARKS